MVINSPCLTDKKELAIPGQTATEPPLSEGHTSGSGEGRMEHAFELTNTVPATPHDSPLTRGYKPRSDEGRLKLLELMNICTSLSNKVTTLENELSSTKVVYHKAFITLTKRVKKLEIQLKQKRSRSLTHSSDEEEPSLDIKDSPKQERMIGEIDKDENVNLRSTTKDKGKGIMQETGLPKKIKKRKMIQLSLNEELAQKLHAEELAKETASQEHEKYNLEKALELQKQLDQREEDVDKAEVRKNMCTYLKNQGGYKQSYFKGMKYEDIRPIFEREEIEAQADTDQEVEEMKLYIKIVPDEEIAIDAIPLATKPPVIVEYKIVKEEKISTYLIIRVDGSTKRYTSMINLLKNIDREDLETLWKLVIDKHGNTRPKEDYERVL
nr:hypothetical protein [Tanacetum cinerariifolium]